MRGNVVREQENMKKRLVLDNGASTTVGAHILTVEAQRNHAEAEVERLNKEVGIVRAVNFTAHEKIASLEAEINRTREENVHYVRKGEKLLVKIERLRDAEYRARVQESIGNEGDADAIRRNAIREVLGLEIGEAMKPSPTDAETPLDAQWLEEET